MGTRDAAADNAHGDATLACSTYINANYIRAFDGTPDWYIATQGPKPGTIPDFWQMVWENNTLAVVMTTGIREGGREKCAQYWPADPGDVMRIRGFTVVNRGTRREGSHMVTDLDLCKQSHPAVTAGIL